MATTFDPSKLSPADQAAFAQWQQSLQQYVAQSGGAIPAPVSYALVHPEYLQQHPELQQDYNIVSGAMLPQTTRDALKDFHPVWGSGSDTPSMQKNSGLFNKWETWLQLGLGAGVAAQVAPAIAAANGIGTGAAGSGTAAGSAGMSAYGPYASGYALPASNAGVPASLAANAATASTPFWKKILPDLIGAGANLAGNAIQSHQVDKSVQAQVDAANKQLALQQNIYQQQRADLAPYRGIGAASVAALSRGLGLPASADTTIPAFQMPQQASVASLAPQQASGMVNMQAPNGVTKQVPADQVAHYTSMGARVV